jgi:hypothetical protein
MGRRGEKREWRWANARVERWWAEQERSSLARVFFFSFILSLLFSSLLFPNSI